MGPAPRYAIPDTLIPPFPGRVFLEIGCGEFILILYGQLETDIVFILLQASATLRFPCWTSIPPPPCTAATFLKGPYRWWRHGGLNCL